MRDILRRVQDVPDKSDKLYAHAIDSVSESEISAQATVKDYEEVFEAELRKAKELVLLGT